MAKAKSRTPAPFAGEVAAIRMCYEITQGGAGFWLKTAKNATVERLLHLSVYHLKCALQDAESAAKLLKKR